MPEKSSQARSMPVPRPHPASTPGDPYPAKQKSRIANGSALCLGKVDGNTAQARRHREVYEALVTALPGPHAPAEPVLILVRQAATLAVDLERMAAAAPNGLPLDPEYVKMGGRLSRIMRSLGLEPAVADASDDPADLDDALEREDLERA